MASLEELREQLDQIDDKIAELYEERMEVCARVGEYKIQAGRKVFDRQREKEKLADVASKVKGEFNRKGIQDSLYPGRQSGQKKCESSISGNRGSLQPGGHAAVFWKRCE